MMQKANIFEFSSYQYFSQKNLINFNYQIKFADNRLTAFTETISLPEKFSLFSGAQSEIFEKCLQSLHLILGVSYWKLYLPKKIIIKTFRLTKDQARFWNTVYTQGLGEFFFRNQIKNFSSLVNFPYRTSLVVKPSPLPRKNRSLVAIGGGKDSLVSLELLKKHHLPVSGIILETEKHSSLISKVIREAKINLITLMRSLDHKLLDLEKNDAYQGHIPISAIYAFSDLLAAVVYDYRYLIFSNEKSSNEGNVFYQGRVINHQWSKSSEFESLFRDYIHRYLTPDIDYFSLLRPWYELRIAEQFSHYPKYWPFFSSCNQNFSISRLPPKNRWCGRCPKCASVFLVLAPFIPKNKLILIFSKNLFEDKKLISVYRGLLGLTKTKPFDCVGTINETRLAFYLIWQKKHYQDCLAVKMFEKEVLSMLSDPEQLKQKILTTGSLDNLPEEFKLIFKQ